MVERKFHTFNLVRGCASIMWGAVKGDGDCRCEFSQSDQLATQLRAAQLAHCLATLDRLFALSDVL